MRKFVLLFLFSVLWAGYGRAQQATGPAAEEARKQVMQFEKEKVPLLLEGGTAFADWLYKMDAEDVLHIGQDMRRSKAEQVALWRSGGMTQFVNDQHDHQVYVYDNGNLAIVTYIGTTFQTVNGRTYRSTVRCVDSWVRQNEKWQRVVHINSPMPSQGSKKSSE